MIFGNDHRDKTENPGPFADFPPPPEQDCARPEAWAAHPSMPRCPPGPLKNWHVADYNLFWENIRLNLTRQVELFGFADRRSRELP
jgi:hypothetical protein